MVSLLPLMIACLALFGCEEGNKMGITIDNYQQFVEKLEAELPAGTPLSAIDNYLSGLNLEHSYSARTRTVYAMVKDIDKRLLGLVTTSLILKFHLDEDEQLQRIEVELESTSI
jgi:hypothetical protein